MHTVKFHRSANAVLIFFYPKFIRSKTKSESQEEI